MRRSCRYFVTLVLATGFALPAGAFQSHRAVYDLSLRSVNEGSSITSVHGRLANEWTKECGGYIFNQRMIMEMIGAKGEGSLLDYHISTWESLDSKAFRFNLRTHVNGELIEEYAGKAELTGADGSGMAVFSKPKVVKLALPAKTLFPTAHSLAALKLAEKGERLFMAATFDGSDEKTVYNASLILGHEDRDLKALGEKFALIRGLRGWPARLAFFKQNEAGAAPSVEMGFVMFTNGVIARLQLDYDDFSVTGKLNKLDKIDDPSC